MAFVEQLIIWQNSTIKLNNLSKSKLCLQDIVSQSIVSQTLTRDTSEVVFHFVTTACIDYLTNIIC